MGQSLDDIRYSELRFLLSFQHGGRWYSVQDPRIAADVRLSVDLCLDMVMTLLEDLYIRLENNADQLLVGRLRREVDSTHTYFGRPEDWKNPREGLERFLRFERSSHSLRITYRGLRRMEELRDVLRAERVLDDHGILLSGRYANRDLEDALRRSTDVPVSVVYADMDGFGRVNKEHSHRAGDVLLKAYLLAVREVFGPHGEAYRVGGDEVQVIVTGQPHDTVARLAENLRQRIQSLQCEYEGATLPKVTASIGVASTPPEPRNRDLALVADQRQSTAKQGGKNRVVST